MKLRFSVLVLTLALCSAGAQAQFGLYLNPEVTRISNSQPDTGPFAFLGQNQTSQIFGGIAIGGYYEAYHAPKFDFSLDLRDAIEHGNNASINSFLFGARVNAKLSNSSMKPYVQLSIGAGRTRAPLSPIPATKLEYDVFAGVDKPLAKHVDWRIVEVGYGSVTTISSYLYAGPVAIPAAKLINFSTGFVFRF
jgi:hypothetical protein